MVDKWECAQPDFKLQHEVIEHIHKDLNDPKVRVMYICGSDLIHSMSLQHLLTPMNGIICGQRPGYPILDKDLQYNSSDEIKLMQLKQRIRMLKQQYGDNMHVIGDLQKPDDDDIFMLEDDLSSTKVRSWIQKRAYFRLQTALHPDVLQFVRDQQLFAQFN